MEVVYRVKVVICFVNLFTQMTFHRSVTYLPLSFSIPVVLYINLNKYLFVSDPVENNTVLLEKFKMF